MIDETDAIEKTIYFLDLYHETITNEVERRQQKGDVLKSNDFVYCISPECEIYPHITDELFIKWQTLADEQKKEYASNFNKCCECWHQRMCGKDQWARAEIERKKRELEEVENELRSLGMDPSSLGEISYNWIASIETGEVPFESLMKREKRCFELVEKWLGLAYSKVRLESDFVLEDKTHIYE